MRLREKLIIQQDIYNEKLKKNEEERNHTIENCNKIHIEYLLEIKKNENLKNDNDSLYEDIKENKVAIDNLARVNKEINQNSLENNSILCIEIKNLKNNLNQSNLMLNDKEKNYEIENNSYKLCMQENNDMKINLENMIYEFNVIKDEKINLEFKLNEFENDNLIKNNHLDELKKDFDVELNNKIININMIENLKFEIESLKNMISNLNKKNIENSNEYLKIKNENLITISELDKNKNLLNLSIIELQDDNDILQKEYDISVTRIRELSQDMLSKNTVFLSVEEELRDARNVCIFLYILLHKFMLFYVFIFAFEDDEFRTLYETLEEELKM